MSAAVVGEGGKTVLPKEICDAAGIAIWDQVDWRFQDGEIRGRKLKDSNSPKFVRPVPFNDLLILPTDLEIDLEQLDKDIAADREEQDGHVLG